VLGHKNAPLTPEGRKLLCERVAAGRAIARCRRPVEVQLSFDDLLTLDS
jgi:hypothetical protein